MAIMELLKMDYDLDDLVAHRASARQIREAALAKGFRPLAMDGIRRILQGVTSLAEVSRMVDLTDRVRLTRYGFIFLPGTGRPWQDP